MKEVVGPMLRQLLADRFQLTIRRERKELPVYLLSLAPGGLKIKPSACIAIDPDHPPEHPPGEDPRKYCKGFSYGKNGPNSTLFGTATMTDLVARALPGITDRFVIDKTGITEPRHFDVRLEWFNDELMSAGQTLNPDGTAGPSILTALREQWGLKLESGKGPVDVLVIEHVERPSAN
jgi:uncharacterized protein (TIGR03435 family)